MNTPEPVAASLDKVSEGALQYARRFKLVRDDGQITCIKDETRGCRGLGTLPTLLCEPCLALRQRGMLK